MPEDFNKLRLISKRLVETKFKQNWQFRLEFDGEPTDFDLFVKDISYGPTEISNEDFQVGGNVLTYPTAARPVSLSMTIRDHEDERISQWFDDWALKVVKADGTFGLPYGSDGYVKKAKRYTVNQDSSETLKDTWEMYPVQRGDVSESRENPGVLEFAATFIQFRSNNQAGS